jgi:predicted kinase
VTLRTVVATVGLPGSGKSCLARQLVAEAVKAGCLMARVNRDCLRDQLYPGCYAEAVEAARLRAEEEDSVDSSPERAVTLALYAQVTTLIGAGWDVICDDTNLDLDRIDTLRVVARVAGADFQVIDMTGVPLEVCIARDAERPDRGYPPTRWDGARVTEPVIRDMHARHFLDGRWRGCDLHLQDANYPTNSGGCR